MTINDPIGDFLTRIRNGQMARKAVITAPASTVKVSIAEVLKDEGYITDYQVGGEGAKRTISVTLKYYEGKPVIEKLERYSRPSLRQYRSKDNLPSVMGGLGVAIVSTSRGVVSDRKARAEGIGGEVLCVVA